MILRLQEDSGRREGDIECPEMSLTTNHNSQVMKKYSWKRNQSGVGNITNISTLFFLNSYLQKEKPILLTKLLRSKQKLPIWKRSLQWNNSFFINIFLCFESFKFEACWCTDLQCWASRSIICWCVGNDSWLELGYKCCSRGVSPAGIPWSYIIWKQQSVWDRKWTVVVWKREMSGEWIQFWRMFKRYPGVSEWRLLVIGNGAV